MKIEWNENPLKSVIELDDRDKEVFRLKVKIKMLEEVIGTAWVYLKDDDSKRDKEYAIQQLHDAAFTDDFEEEVDQQYEWYLHALSEPHCGDCTCVPATCMKCLAEDIAGVNTIKGLPKHSATYFQSSTKSIDEMLEHLSQPTDRTARKGFEKYTKEQYEALCQGWDKHREYARNWLRKYKEEHFNDNENNNNENLQVL
jgi:hypothetical protein